MKALAKSVLPVQIDVQLIFLPLSVKHVEKIRDAAIIALKIRSTARLLSSTAVSTILKCAI